MSTATAEKPATKPEAKKADLPSAEDFFGKAPPVKGTTEEFLKKFAVGQRENLENTNQKIDALPKAEPNQEEIEQKQVDDARIEERTNQRKLGFVKSKIEEARTLKAERDNLAKAKSDADAEIESLKKQIAEAKTVSEDKELREQLNRATEERTNLEIENKKVIDSLQARLDFQDIQQNPVFIKDFVAPIRTAHESIVKAIGRDRQAMEAFSRVKNANDGLYRAKNDAEREAAEQQLDSAREEFIACLPEYRKYMVDAKVEDLIGATQNYNKALVNWASEKTRIVKQTEQEQQRARENFLSTWKESYKKQGEAIESEISIDPEVEEYMKTNKIDFDLSKDERVALIATQQAEGDATPDDTNRLIQQGRVYNKSLAIIKALKGMLKEKDDYISQLKGSTGREDSPRKKVTQETDQKPNGLNGFLSKWGPR